jgi:hypothetical protein
MPKIVGSLFCSNSRSNLYSVPAFKGTLLDFALPLSAPPFTAVPLMD